MQKFIFNICLVKYADQTTEFLSFPWSSSPELLSHGQYFYPPHCPPGSDVCPDSQGLESLSETICCWLCLCFSLLFIFVIFNLWFVLYSSHYYAFISYLESLHRDTLSSVWHLPLHFELDFHNRQSLIRSFVAELLFLKLFYIFLYNFLNVFTLLHRSFK